MWQKLPLSTNETQMTNWKIICNLQHPEKANLPPKSLKFKKDQQPNREIGKRHTQSLATKERKEFMNSSETKRDAQSKMQIKATMR